MIFRIRKVMFRHFPDPESDFPDLENDSPDPAAVIFVRLALPNGLATSFTTRGTRVQILPTAIPTRAGGG